VCAQVTLTKTGLSAVRTFSPLGVKKLPINSLCTGEGENEWVLKPTFTIFEDLTSPISNSGYHIILEPVLGWPSGYTTKHCSESLLKKDFIPFLSSYAHSSTVTCIFFPL
jgi:hypothetical protein